MDQRAGLVVKIIIGRPEAGFAIFKGEQDAYALLDLMASVQLTDHVRTTLNINNATDEKHLNSVMWDQAYYGEPRSVFLSLDYVY